MAFTLAKASARRNGHRPPPRRCPGPHPLAEPVGRVVMTHSAREARGVPLALHPHPAHRSHRERVERGGVERRAAAHREGNHLNSRHGAGPPAVPRLEKEKHLKPRAPANSNAPISRIKKKENDYPI